MPTSGFDAIEPGVAFQRQAAFLKKMWTSLGNEIKTVTEQGRKITQGSGSEVTLLFKGMMKPFDDMYSKFVRQWEEIIQHYMLNDKEAEFPTEADKNVYANAKRYYYEAHAKLIEINEANRPNTSAEMSFNTTQSFPARARFPKLKLPTFSGILSEWPIFRDNFLALVHNDGNISKMDKYHYLLGYVSDRALDVIKAIPFLENNYDLAWKALLKTFDHKRTLASSYVNTLVNFKPMMGQASTDTLQHFLSTVPPNIAAFKNLKINKPDEYILFELAIRILDTKTREAFELKNSNVDYPTFESLVDFVEERLRALQMSNLHYSKEPIASKPESLKPPKTPRHSEPNKNSYNVLTANTSTSNGAKANFTSGLPCCKLCSKSHRIADCPALLKATALDRLAMLKQHRCCFNCLHPGQHTSFDCKSSKRCDQCHRRHHSLLHHAFKEKQPTNVSSTPTNVADASVQLALYSKTKMESTSILLGTATVQIMDSKGSLQPVRLVLDSGSQRSLMTKTCAQKLGLSTTKSPHTLVGIGQSTLNENLGQVNCRIKTDRRNRPFLSTTCLVVSTITSELPQTTLPISVIKKLESYKLADRTFWKPGPIDLLLGADMYGEIVTGKPIFVSPNNPNLIDTVFGHIVFGKCQISPDPTSTVLLNCCVEEINSTLKRFWAVEEPTTTKIVSPDDEYCEKHFLDTHHRLESGRYVAHLPFNGHQSSLGESRHQALTRFLRLEATLMKTSCAKKSYDDFLKEYIDLGHMTLAKSPAAYYLPHHAVEKMDDVKGKIRVVFDASAKAQTRSLNDCLHSGRKLQLDITDILLNFRRHKFVFTADIKKMYRQILIDPSETKFQHILWRFRPDQEIQEFELLTLTYGMSCAPFIALRVIQQLIHDEGSSYPQAAEILKTDIYIDDVVTGASSFDKALDLMNQLVELLRKGCFELGKWSSNSSDLLKAASVSEEDSLINLSNNEDKTIKILGLQWNSTIDSFSYKIRNPPEGITKRLILSTTARLYDPLGFLSPVIFTAKRILQDIWIAGSGWDESPPPKLARNWMTFLSELPTLSQVEIPRFLKFNEVASYTIVGFSDASELGYCAALYLRVHFASQVSLFLLKSKTKLAPLKPNLSIPRLELLGARLLTTLLTSIDRFLTHLRRPKIYLFTDSMTVLSWLKTPAHQLKTYVAQRINSILEDSEPTLWHHVRSKDNPADLGSRGLMPSQIIDNRFWWNGPTWLSNPIEEWPLEKSIPIPITDLPEVKQDRVVLVHVVPNSWDMDQWMERFSKYPRMIRSLCYVYRFLGFKFDKRTGPITNQEFDHATTVCIKYLQKKFYPDHDKNHSHLFQILNVFKDDVGLYRVGGRLRNSHLPFEEKHPILLPRRCHFNNLLIDFYHKTNLHVGTQTLNAIIHRKYWIPSCKNLIKQRSRLCKPCMTIALKPQPPYMGDLPASRLEENTVFHLVGVDFAGPLLCRETSRRKSNINKAYLCIFVCFATKAMHIEIANQLTTEAFLDCLDRFIARRGVPAQIFSDCGTNFVGASNYLKEVEDWLKLDDTKQSLVNFATIQGITWNFNPPRTPHFGGLWEAGVKSVKSLLFKTLGNQPFTEKELNTVCVKIEGILNSRPLTPMSDDVNDLQPLTPAHFLVGKASSPYPEYDFSNENTNRLSRWQYLRRQTQDFWNRWKVEYLQTLQPRKKWQTNQPNIKIGDMVLVTNEDSPPFQWPLARVITVTPGSDNIVRVVTIRTTKGTYQRPVTKLVRLPFVDRP